MVSLGSYLLSAVELVAVALSLGFSAYRLRQRLLPDWDGAPARLVEAIAWIALLIWVSEILGTFGFFYAGALVAACLILALIVFWRIRPATADAQALSPAGGAVGGAAPEEALATGGGGGSPAATGPAGQSAWELAVMGLVVAATVFSWAVTTKHALDRGIFNFDSLWYHLPFAADMVQSHSLAGLHYTDTVFTNWFYPQNSEVLHAVGMLLTGRDTLSLFVNFGWLALAFLAAWCIGRPYGRGPLTVIAAAILLECHTLVVREPGAAKNDLAPAALLLAAIAILLTAWARQRGAEDGGPQERERGRGGESSPSARAFLPVGWSLACAGLAVGLAVGTRYTAVAMAVALSLAVLVLAPAGRRRAAALWWFVPALLGGGYWYLRNLLVAGNPLPEIEGVGPISLPHPQRLQSARPDFSVVHYATDTGVWRHYFAPGLHEAFGALWPLVLLGAAGAALWALLRGRNRPLRWVGGVALFGMVAYLFTPLTAAGAQGIPLGFGINVRYVIPALLAGIVLLPLPRRFDDSRWRWGLLAALLVVFLLSDRPDAALHDPARLFAVALVALAVLVPAALLVARGRGVTASAVLAAFAVLALAVVALGYPLQRHYLEGRFANTGSHDEQIPGMSLDSAYRWARGVEDARIGLVGTTAGFAGYGFYGTDLSNEVRYLGARGPDGAYNAIPTCAAFRAAVNAADLDYLVTAPFLNFIHPSAPIPSPEARWLRGEPAVRPIRREGPVTVWKVRGRLDPSACGPRNAPLREIPNSPAG